MQLSKFIKFSFAGKKRCIAAIICFISMAVIFLLNINCLKEDNYENSNMMLSLVLVNLIICFLLFIKIEFHELLADAYSYVWFVLVPFILIEISGIVVIKLFTFESVIFYKNLIIYFVLQLLVYAIVNRIKLSIMISFSIWWVFFVADYLVIQVRGIPVVPADFYALGTAAKVAGNYSFKFSVDIFNFVQVYVLVLLVTIYYAKEVRLYNKKHLLRILCFVMAIGGFVLTANFKFEEDSVGFYQYRFNSQYGIVYNMYMNFYNMQIKKPDYYDREAVCELINESALSSDRADNTEIHSDNNENDENATLTVKDNKTPNIIAIMNESFADLRILGDIQTNIPYMTFWDEFTKRDDVYSGKILVSAFGGNTCNTEFEFLTGYSMIFFPYGTTPYNQYITKNTTSLCTHLSGIGYNCDALHPYWANCWQRNTNYVYLGFDKFISGENFVTGNVTRKKLVDMGGRDFGDGVEYIRNYISDKEDYKKLISMYEEKDKNSPLFTFNVTIQNHGGYTYDDDDFVDEVECTNYWYYSLDEYLTLAKITNESLEYLINYFESYEEPTIIVFFGDHQPSIEKNFYKEIFGKAVTEETTENGQNNSVSDDNINVNDGGNTDIDGDIAGQENTDAKGNDNVDSTQESDNGYTLEETQLKHMTPYFIWANYEMNEIDAPEITSANYLQSLVLEAAGIEKNAVSNYMDKIIDKYPAMNRNGVMTAEGDWITIKEALKDPDLQMYNNLTYYGLFDK